MGRVAAQAAIAKTAQELKERSAALLDSVDPAAPFSMDVAAQTAELFVVMDEATTKVRREIVMVLAGVYTHEELAVVVGMSPWWVGKVLREAGKP
ncbi:hypothetical protein EV641_106195 [Rhodococcus sp. SMB37]|uniref:hypothetical protein n=1 Tax=Rhodococcus sp. SMB37 TaxID=2512213 RepID=UPI00104781AD|nr:hypothetical protein [Rhodococcus sp. SMB37]TCN53549.1 hypothetical protein EV641_106195 [Rhodococcus sp. SMB37]